MLNEALNTSDFIDKIRGHVTVELFDANSGKLVEKQEKHNFIANSGKDYLRYLQRVNFKNQISAIGGAAYDTDKQMVDCFNNIALTDSVLSISPSTEWSIPGKLIGWSNKGTYSGADTFRGSPNATLSLTNSSLTKWVFDWPIQAAIGSIGSVCWGNSVGGTETFIGTSTLMQSQTFPGARPIAYANSNMIFGGSGTTVTVYNSSMAQLTSFTTISCSGIAWDSVNSKLWVISGSQIASYSSTGTVINAPMSITARSYRGLTFDGTNLWTTVVSDPLIYCLSTSNGSTVTSFSLSSISFENYASTGYYQYNSGRDICWDSTRNCLAILRGVVSGGWTRLYQYDTSGNLVGPISSLNAWNGSSYIGNHQNAWVGGTDYIYTTSYFDIVDKDTYVIPRYDATLATIRVDSMGSRVLLPSPITKTNAQTLRVTYQMDYS